MEVAIKEVLPGTKHMWCKWHILSKAKERLGHLYSKKSKSGFKADFHKLIETMLTVSEFEAGWKHMLQKYKLQKNDYLDQIYMKRERWAKPYFKDIFCAKQTSTQRSESGNSMIKKLIGPTSPMHNFVEIYQHLQFDRESAEAFEERLCKLVMKITTLDSWLYSCFKYFSNKFVVPLLQAGKVIVHNIPIEWHAAQIYTRKMFEKFGELIFESGDFVAFEVTSKVRYVVEHVRAEKREHWQKVCFTIDVIDHGEKYICECGLSEHMGMLCPHIIRVHTTPSLCCSNL